MPPTSRIAVAALVLPLGLATAQAPAPIAPCRGPTYAEFGFRLLSTLLQQPQTPNVVISPASAGMAFGLVLQGSSGETRRQLVAALHVPDDPVAGASIGPGRACLSQLQGTDDPLLTIATSLWLAHGYQLRPAFAQRSQEQLAPTLQTVDFADPRTRDLLNTWASHQTHGRIPTFYTTPLDPGLRLVILNAVYFKGSWLTEFPTKATSPGPFRNPPGRAIIVPYMHLLNTLPYHAQSRFQAIDLPYTGARLLATVLLPAPGITADSLLPELAAGRWAELRHSMRPRLVDLALPRFRAAGQLDLIPAMRALGVTLSFDPRAAQIDAIVNPTDPPLYVSESQQATFLEVTEQGTEAAAVTGMALIPRDIAAAPLSLIVDRPFLFVLHDQMTGLILFLGRIANPAVPEN